MRRTLGLMLLLAGCAHQPEVSGLDHVAARMIGPAMLQASEGSRVVDRHAPASPEERRQWYVVLGRIQDPQTVDLVVAGLADHAVLREAAFAAGQLGLAWEPLEAPQLEKLTAAVHAALPSATTGAERAALLNALGKLHQPSATADLLAALHDPDAAVRREAAQGLGALAHATQGASPGTEVIDPLNAILLHDPDAEVRFAAGYALLRTKRPEARPGLTYGLKDGDARVRSICAKGLAEVATDAELPYLLERLGDKDQAVQVESARSLGKLAARCSTTGCPAAAAAQSALLVLASGVDPARPESGMALLALVQEKLPAAMRSALEKVALPEAKNAIDAHGRAILACSIAAAADRSRTDAITPALERCQPVAALRPWHAALTARTLAGQPGDPRGRAQALLALPVNGPLVAGAIDDGLGELKVDLPAVRARLLSDLASPDWGVALSAADAAGKLGMTEAVPGLVRAATLADVNLQDDALSTVLGHLAKLDPARGKQLALVHARSPRATARAGALAA